ncbi:hypothetical protein THRCLA_21773 [Thraustotheca clavata]|uniref:EF-hand domain-containing protein n=1 Tax=Thraustotheca clavata TaxID=74557 RepID=A0A1V9ZPV4_9STRA|nr:hypothetical protein THRCLA_21773 [Thraustotheca clavata]
MEAARELFKRVDVSGDGVIDRNEMGTLLQAMGIEPSNQNIVAAMLHMDVTHVGTVSFDQFYDYYKTNFLPRQPTKSIASKCFLDIGEAKPASYTLPPKAFCYGKALQRDKENAAQVLRQQDNDDHLYQRKKKSIATSRPASAVFTLSSVEYKQNKVINKTECSMDRGMEFILSQLKAQVKSRGASGLLGLTRRFRIMDDDNSKGLSMVELKKAFKEIQVDVSEKDIRVLFEFFDKDNNGTIDWNEFIAGLSDPMNEMRCAVVKEAFDALDKDGNGVLEPSDIKGKYDTSKHPDVRSGLKTEVEVLAEFLGTFFESNQAHRSAVSWDDFRAYYQNLSNSIESDELFCTMVKNAWRVKPAVKSWSSTRPATARPKTSNNPPKAKSQGHFPRVTTAWLSTDSASSLLYNKEMNEQKNTSTEEIPAIDLSILDLGTKGILTRISWQMKSIGIQAFLTVQRHAKLSPWMNLNAFKNVIKEAGVAISDKDLRVLFQVYDPKHTGSIHFATLVNQALCQPMPDNRRIIVRKTFRSLDSEKMGSISYGDFIERFDASAHPDVKFGKYSEAEVHSAFHDSFIIPSSVTQEAFEAYYEILSNTITDDKVFEALVQDVWHTRFEINDDTKSEKSTVRWEVQSNASTIKKDPLKVYQESVIAQKVEAAKRAASIKANSEIRRASRATKSSISRATKTKSQRKSWT